MGDARGLERVLMVGVFDSNYRVSIDKWNFFLSVWKRRIRLID